tara:strand:- start:176 stop:910 length:735 start_codon:yes stop_codon:yes gene_type:complete
MDQARVLQSFISNIEMNRSNIPYQQVGQGHPLTDNIPFQQGNGIVSSNSSELIPVSDGDGNGDSDEDSDDDDSDSDDDSDDDSDNESVNESNSDRININVIGDDITISSENAISPHSIIDLDHEFADLDSHKTNSGEEEVVKVIQLDNNFNLEESIVIPMQDLEEIMNNVDDSDDDDSDSDDNDSDSDVSHNGKNMLENTLPIVDFNSLNVKTLRQMVTEKALATEGDKLKKKDLIKLLESDKN